MHKIFIEKPVIAIRGTFLKENINFNSYKFSHKLASIPFSSFCMKQKQEPYFMEVGVLVTKNVSAFCL